MPWSIRLEIAQQASNGLAYLHKNSIVNCNIKPGNIFTGSGKGSHYIAKNGDFGKGCQSPVHKHVRMVNKTKWVQLHIPCQN